MGASPTQGLPPLRKVLFGWGGSTTAMGNTCHRAVHSHHSCLWVTLRQCSHCVLGCCEPDDADSNVNLMLLQRPGPP